MTTFDLFSAVRDGNTEIVRRLLQTRQCRARLNDRNEWGDTALHLAAETGNTEICQMLRAAGASVTVRNNRGETCLHRASVGGHVEACRAIVAQGQDPESVNSQNDAGYTALHHAARHGSKSLIEILLKANADRMIENNAGETPYMVAQRSQQFEAERLLLNVEKQHADQATHEMNRKEKEIIQAYFRAVDHASHLESRVRLMLVGDNGSGKSSLKKTVFGDNYDPKEKRTSGIDADPSVTRINFKQYREWILQTASKADAGRLNLEYIDIIIDYILSSLHQPRVSDDAFNVEALQIEKEKVLKVGFRADNIIIPQNPIFETSREFGALSISHSVCEGGEGVGMEAEEPEGIREVQEEEEKEEEEGEREEVEALEGETAGEQVDEEEEEEVEEAVMQFSHGALTSSVEVRKRLSTKVLQNGEEEVENASPPEPEVTVHTDSQIRYTSSVSVSTSIGTSIATSNSLPTLLPSSGISFSGGTHESSEEVKSKPIIQSLNRRLAHQSRSLSSGHNARVRQESSAFNYRLTRKKSNLIHHETRRDSTHEIEPVFRMRGELSRLLLEHVPREILKRMVIRWPVGDEQVVSRTELNQRKLTLSTWDVSGDPIQQNFTPFFFSHRSLFVVSYNLMHKLDSPCESYASKNLRDLENHIPTNAEVLESWLGCITAFSKHTPSLPFRCTENTPVLPAIILTCTFADKEEVRDQPIVFYKFFSRESFSSYKKHLVDGDAPSSLLISNRFETEGAEGYSGHHLLRREIDHLTRQMPYCSDNIPIQWVKFEQLIYGLQDQKKVVLLYNDLTHYLTEHCSVTGTLQVLPVLSHFHEIGIISYFYRHPLLSNIVIIKPKWLLDALGSMITSTPINWITPETQEAFSRLRREGIISRENFQMAYRCSRLHQRYWNETLFIFNCMDLLCCHPSLHDSTSFFIPCLVTQLSPQRNGFAQIDEQECCMLHFSSGAAYLPMAVFNQLIVRLIRGSKFPPKIFYCTTHLRLNDSHHLIISKHHASISLKVERDHDKKCRPCFESFQRAYRYSPRCANIHHLIGEHMEYYSTDNIVTLIKLSNKLCSTEEPHLAFNDSQHSPNGVCPSVLSAVQYHLMFISECWFPGLKLDLLASVDGEEVLLDQCWHHTVRNAGKAPPSLSVWFD